MKNKTPTKIFRWNRIRKARLAAGIKSSLFISAGKPGSSVTRGCCPVLSTAECLQTPIKRGQKLARMIRLCKCWPKIELLRTIIRYLLWTQWWPQWINTTISMRPVATTSPHMPATHHLGRRPQKRGENIDVLFLSSLYGFLSILCQKWPSCVYQCFYFSQIKNNSAYFDNVIGSGDYVQDMVQLSLVKKYAMKWQPPNT